MLYVESIKLAGATFTAIVGATAPLYAAPLSALLLREPPGAMTLAGTMLAVGGVILGTGLPGRGSASRVGNTPMGALPVAASGDLVVK